MTLFLQVKSNISSVGENGEEVEVDETVEHVQLFSEEYEVITNSSSSINTYIYIFIKFVLLVS